MAGDEASVYAAPNSTWFDAYHPIADHYSFIDDLAASYADNAETFVAGKSHDGRDIKGIHIYGSEGKGSKPGIVWHGTVHAREWITTMVCTCFFIPVLVPVLISAGDGICCIPTPILYRRGRPSVQRQVRLLHHSNCESRWFRFLPIKRSHVAQEPTSYYFSQLCRPRHQP